MEQKTNSISVRKPHNHLPGYRAELKSKHPDLTGHIVIFDRVNGGDWIDALDRWVVMHINGDDCGGMVSVASLASARDAMKHVANGGNEIDLGQKE